MRKYWYRRFLLVLLVLSVLGYAGYEITKRQEQGRKKEVSARDMEQLLNSKVSEADVTTHTEDLKSKIVSECVKNLPDSCYKIISLFYYEQKNYDEIMEMSDNYTSKDALKTRKYKCMEQLQKRIEEKFNMYNLKPYLHERGNFK